jgi:polyhydroxybutyrate depolymerase
MCHRLTAKLSDRIAAIGPVAGTIAIERCYPGRPVSVVHFLGTKDGFVPYGGSDEHTPKSLKLPSVDESIRIWVKLNGFPRELTVIHLPGRTHDGAVVRRKRHGPGEDGSGMVLNVIEAGGNRLSERDRFQGRLFIREPSRLMRCCAGPGRSYRPAHVLQR